MRGGHLVRVPSAQLVTGDLLVLAEGDSVGADARLIQVASLRVQPASLTGESEAVLKDIATLPNAAALLGGLIAPIGETAEGGDIANARTAGFTVLVMAHLFQCFNARSETASAFKNLFVNPWLWGAVTLSVLLQVAVVNVPFLNLAFGTVPLMLDQWLTCLAMAGGVLRHGELRKLVTRLALSALAHRQTATAV